MEKLIELLNENEKIKEKSEGKYRIIGRYCYTSANIYCTKEEENRKLREENDKLKSDLDRFSEAYKKYRDYEKEELAESCYDFARENKELKGENEQLRKRIKEHCNTQTLADYKQRFEKK